MAFCIKSHGFLRQRNFCFVIILTFLTLHFIIFDVNLLIM